ncbi:hypothetical protein GCM10009727_34170 [Actinomadura napierensis]|uniref:Uncharacterized protein n=1 Tax=Actinomadura napierensis TaxID=267854 RepID=A0ABN2Z8D1_9ACTN
MEGVPDGEPVPGVSDPGVPDPGVPVGPSVPGTPVGADTEGVGLGPGGVAWAAIGTATAETHVAANAAPLTSTLRTPGPFVNEPGGPSIDV